MEKSIFIFTNNINKNKRGPILVFNLFMKFMFMVSFLFKYELGK